MASAPFCVVAGWARRGGCSSEREQFEPQTPHGASGASRMIPDPLGPFSSIGVCDRTAPAGLINEFIRTGAEWRNWGSFVHVRVSARSARGTSCAWVQPAPSALFSTWCSRDVATPPLSCAWGPRLFPLVSGFLIGHSWPVIGEDAALVCSPDKRQGPNPGRWPRTLSWTPGE